MAAEESAEESKTMVVNPVRTGIGRNHAVKWAVMLEEEDGDDPWALGTSR